jgi:N-acetyl-alpha-D-glucosaminyl L-malate synthase BshA
MKRARSKAVTDGARSAAPRAKRPSRARRIGITCYSHFGGSGVVATELGLALARRGYQVHFIAHSLPFRLRTFESNIFFHEALPASYPVFDQAPYNLALTTKMVEVAENYDLDLLHVHYAMPFAASAYLARELIRPRSLGVVTTLHGTDITVVGVEPAFFRVTQFTIQSSDRVTAVSRFLKERTEKSFGITRPIEVIYNFVDPRCSPLDAGPPCVLAPPHTSVIMHASNFRPVKNISAVIKVFSEVRKQLPAKLVMVGDGPDKAGAEQLARELEIQRDVLFLGNQDCMEELLPLADVSYCRALPRASGSWRWKPCARKFRSWPRTSGDCRKCGAWRDGLSTRPAVDRRVRVLGAEAPQERAAPAHDGTARPSGARQKFDVNDMVDRYNQGLRILR